MFTTCADEGLAEINNAAATAAPHNNRFICLSPSRGVPRERGTASRIRTTRDLRRVNSLAPVCVGAFTALETRFRNADSAVA
jgi:hypothetical protein